MKVVVAAVVIVVVAVFCLFYIINNYCWIENLMGTTNDLTQESQTSFKDSEKQFFVYPTEDSVIEEIGFRTAVCIRNTLNKSEIFSFDVIPSGAYDCATTCPSIQDMEGWIFHSESLLIDAGEIGFNFFDIHPTRKTPPGKYQFTLKACAGEECSGGAWGEETFTLTVLPGPFDWCDLVRWDY